MRLSSTYRIVTAFTLLALPVLTGAKGNGCNVPVSIGGDGGGDGGGDDGGSGGSGGGDDAACPGFEPLATPEELALTPMEYPGAELLAREATNSFIAPLDVYERVKRDLAAIHALEPDVAGISGSRSTAGSVEIRWTEAGKAAVDAGTYPAWDCLNSYYGATAVRHFDVPPVSYVRFDANFDDEKLAMEYAKLPDVEFARTEGLGGDGSDACLSIDGEEYSYILDLASGDCQAGCTDHVYYGFTTTPDGAVTPLGRHANSDPAEPGWFTELEECRRRLQ
ncbi:hypothetical protein [Sorangium sp. So ce1097]|uniref:hypothetical protein n=1 Tax=Sorangium sp. So ce1097 TaxID=3133330 RepID=UPI003F64118B